MLYETRGVDWVFYTFYLLPHALIMPGIQMLRKKAMPFLLRKCGFSAVYTCE